MQRQMTIQEQKIKTCLFTGHRELKEDFSLSKLREYINFAIEQGAEIFYTGMAKGFDLYAGEEVLRIKAKNPKIKLVACVPFYEQEKAFSKSDKFRYAEIIKKADEVVCLAENYYRGCMQARNRYMAERGDMMICYCKKEKGGTAYTVNYFQKKYPEKQILFL